MRGVKAILWACALVVALPWAAFAQAGASITGTVRGSSGAVLPGVTVEAASPALIEKVRTVVTDGMGQYKIIDLRPGLSRASNPRSRKTSSSPARSPAR